MKKLILLALAAIMVFSMIPAMAFTASADETEEVVYPDPSDDFFSVWRDPSNYDVEDGEPYRPAAGYEYTDEGFKVISPDFSNYGAKVNVSTSQPVDLKDGFYMEVRVDDFSYTGTSGKEDEWIAFTIADSALASPADTKTADGWSCLIRGQGNGQWHRADVIGSFKNVRQTEANPAGSFAPWGAFDIEAFKNNTVVKDGIEYYTFEVSYDGSEYTLKVNGVALSGATGFTDYINGLDSTYVVLTLHTGQMGGKADVTITKVGTSEASAEVPEGDDSREPEENLLVYGDLIDPTTVPENQPALILDANKTSVKKDPTGSNISLTPTGSGSYHVQASGDIPYFTWGIRRELTYNAQDFPVVVMMLKNFIGEDGGAYYCAGTVIAANDAYMQGWSQWDDNARFYGGDDEYTYIVMDFTDMINNDEALQGRFHSVRPHFGVDSTDEEESQWDIEFMACFRSVEEALAYGDWYNETVIVPAIETENPDETTEGGDETTVGGDETTVGGDDETTVGGDETTADDDETTVGGDETTADTKAEETKAEEKGGCGSVIGMGAVAIMAAAAAAVVLKKKD